jgi:hypothetical protein
MTLANHNLNIRHCETQKQQILEWLLLGLPITPMEALQMFGTFKLSTRCSELIADGFPIQKETITLENGKRVTKYRF